MIGTGHLFQSLASSVPAPPLLSPVPSTHVQTPRRPRLHVPRPRSCSSVCREDLPLIGRVIRWANVTEDLRSTFSWRKDQPLPPGHQKLIHPAAWRREAVRPGRVWCGVREASPLLEALV